MINNTTIKEFAAAHKDDSESRLSQEITRFVTDHLNEILVHIPERYQYSESLGGDNPTKYDFAWYYVFEQVQGYNQ